MDVLLALLWLVGCIGALIGGLSLANWVLRPLEQAAKKSDCPTQFTLSDLLGLFFLMPVSMSLPYFGLPPLDPAIHPTVGIAIWIGFGLLWWYGVRKLSRAGVRNPTHRILFLVLLIPFTLLGAVAFPFAAVSVVATLYSPNPAEFAVACGATLLLISVFYGLGRLSRRLIASTADPTTEPVDQVSENKHLPDDTYPSAPDGPTPPS